MPLINWYDINFRGILSVEILISYARPIMTAILSCPYRVRSRILTPVLITIKWIMIECKITSWHVVVANSDIKLFRQIADSEFSKEIFSLLWFIDILKFLQGKRGRERDSGSMLASTGAEVQVDWNRKRREFHEGKVCWIFFLLLMHTTAVAAATRGARSLYLRHT